MNAYREPLYASRSESSEDAFSYSLGSHFFAADAPCLINHLLQTRTMHLNQIQHQAL